MRKNKNILPQRTELTYHEGHEEHEAFSRRDAGLSAGVRQTGRRGLSVSSAQTGSGKIGMKDE